MKNYVIFVLQGMLMGMAEIVPGVSGSALALMLGFYHRMIDVMDAGIRLALKVPQLFTGKVKFQALLKELKESDWRFGAGLAVGFALAAVLLSHAIDAVYEAAPQYMQALFFGIIAASIVVTFSKLKNRSVGTWLLVLLSAVIVFAVIGLTPGTQESNPNLGYVFLVSLLAVSGMVLPGISGGYVLVIFGLYEYLIKSIKNFTTFSASPNELATLVIFGVGIALGFLIAVRSIKIAFDKYHDQTTAIMLGLMLGSLRGLWPFFAAAGPVWPWQSENAVVISLIVLIGFGFIFGISRIAQTRSIEAD